MFWKIFGLLIVVFIFSSCGDNKVEPPRVIRINYSHTLGGSTLLVMKQKDFLSAYLPSGVNIEWVQTANSAETRDALASGHLDIVNISASGFIPAIENGLPMVLLSSGTSAPVKVYSNNPNIKSLRDIGRGDRIAIRNKGNIGWLAFMIACQEEFGNPLEFESNLVPIPEPEALALLASASNELDVAIFLFPMTIKADQSENITVIADLLPIAKKYNFSSYIAANKNFFDNNPELIEAFMKAQRATIDFINQHPDQAAYLLSEHYGVEPEYIEWAFKEVPPQMNIAGYDRIADTLYKAGILTKEPRKFSDLPKYKDLIYE
jgi:NitT/TauT family transport system substrate-binding protein